MSGRRRFWREAAVMLVAASAPLALAADTTQASFREDLDQVTVIEFSGGYEIAAGGETNALPRQQVAEQFFLEHADNYDFLVAFTTFPFDLDGANAWHLAVRNDVEGLGLPLFDNSADFGSAGRLQGFIDMGPLDQYVLDRRDPQFERVLRTLGHEVLHQWAAYVGYRRADGSISGELLGASKKHWSYLLDTNASVLYGSDWTPQSDGSFRATAVDRFFSPLDLYLAGFVAPAEVPDFTLIENPAVDATALPELGATLTGAPIPISVTDVIAAEGERFPSAATSQKEFRAAIVLLTRPGEDVDPAVVAGLNSVREAFGQRFTAWTGGRAFVEIFPEQRTEGETGDPGGIDSGQVRTTDASIEDGLAWLRAAQAVDGFWQDRQETRLRDSVVALGALSTLDADFSRGPEAVAWLREQEPDSVDDLARQAAAVGAEEGDNLSAVLRSRQNLDGGWALKGGFASDPLDSALAGRALVAAGSGPLPAAGAFLLQNQTSDGGWPLTIGGASRAAVTAEVMRALHAGGVAGDWSDRGATFLASRQNADGGFGDSPSTAHDTALVLLALMETGGVEAVRASDAVDYLLSRQTVDGSWEGSVYATALVVQAVQKFAFPNLQFEGQAAVQPATPRDGERVRLTLEIVNTGNITAPESVLRLFDGEPSAGGLAIGSDTNLPALAPGGTASVERFWDTFDQEGERVLFAFVDADEAIDEASELDNQLRIPITVEPAPDTVELEVTSQDIVVLPEHPDRLPEQLAVTTVARNLGQVAIAEVVVETVLTMPSGATQVDRQTVGIPERSSVAANSVLDLTEAGVSTVTVRLDPDNLVVESLEDNNQAQRSIATKPSVDFGVDSSEVVMQGAPYVGHDVTFDLSVHNFGTIDSPDATLVATISSAGGSLELLRTTIQIAHGDQQTFSVPWRVDRLEASTFTVTVDVDDEVQEADETNNSASVSVTPSTLDFSNLTLDHQDILVTPDPIRDGASFEVSSVVRNNGGVDVDAPFEVAFYYGDPAQNGLHLATTTVPSLVAGASTSVSTSLSTDLPSGAGSLFVLVDAAGAIAEFDESDNQAFREVDVVSLPDLVVSPLGVVHSPAVPEVGEPVQTTVTVHNLGEQTASSFEVDLRVDGVPLAPSALVDALGPDAQQSVVFDWTFPEVASLAVRVEADSGNVVAERDETNNAAESELFAFDPDQTLYNRYFSPNGDGVKDTTTVNVALSGVESAVVETAAGEVIRTHAVVLSDDRVRFAWDGRDDDGTIARDGDYRIKLVDGAQRTLHLELVTVDTNRWPLFEALDTEFERISNLTCNLPVDGYTLTKQEDVAYVRRWHVNGSISQLPYRSWNLETIFEDSYPGGPTVSPLGDYFVFRRSSGANDGTWVGNEDGSASVLFPEGAILGQAGGAVRGYWFSPSGDALIYVPNSNPDQVRERSLYGGSEQILVSDLDVPGSFSVGDPRKEKLLFDHCVDGFNTRCDRLSDGGTITLFDLDNASSRTIFEGQFHRRWHRWSPSGGRFVVFSLFFQEVPGNYYGRVDAGSLNLFDRNGEALSAFEIPRRPLAEVEPFANRTLLPSLGVHLWDENPPRWVDDGSLVVGITLLEEFGDPYGEYDTALRDEVLLVDIETNDYKVIGLTETFGPYPYGYDSYEVSTWDGSDWVSQGELHFGIRYGLRTLDLSEHLPDADGEYKLRIRQQGLDAAHIDKISLDFDGDRREPGTAPVVEIVPVAATDTATGNSVLTPLQYLDHDVLDAHEREFEVRWEVEDQLDDRPAVLRLIAREETLSGRDAHPFLYPGPDDAFEVHLASGSGMQMDGEQTAADNLEEHLFEQWSLPGTGHPGAEVLGYVNTDADALYAALDFTVDNTLDGGEDWASLWVETSSGWREFRVSAEDSTWGVAGFTRTGAVHHPHKYYEFRVPFSELSAEPGDTLRVRFEAYGTAAVLDSEPGIIPVEPYSEMVTLPVPNEDRTVLYAGEVGSLWLLDHAGREPRRIFEEFTTLGYPWFSPSGTKFLFWDGRDVLDPQHDCYAPHREQSVFAFDSLANLTAELEIEIVPGQPGLSLVGTATDLNFAHYRIDVAAESAPDLWTPIGPPVESQVRDDLLATWSPSAGGGQLVRLTVEDLAGNRKTVTRRIEAGVSSSGSLSDVTVTPRLFSPNGDGVKDRAVLYYRTLKPVNLEISVRDLDGDIVRTWSKTHTALDSYQLAWDGRDQAGLPLEDGQYRIEVQNLRFLVTVDATAPVAQGSISGPLNAGLSLPLRANRIPQNDTDPHYYSESRVRALATDAHIKSAQLEASSIDGSSWSIAAPLRRNSGASSEFVLEDSLPLAQLMGRQYRVVAEDGAGNRSTEILEPIQEALVLDGIGETESTALLWPLVSGNTVTRGIPLRLGAAETIAEQLAQVWIEYRYCYVDETFNELCDPWFTAPAVEILSEAESLPGNPIPDLRFEVVWDASDLDPNRAVDVLLTAKTLNGTEYRSNRITLLPPGLAFLGSEYDHEDLGLPLQDLAAARAAGEIDAPLFGYKTIAADLVDVRLTLTSSDDPRYQAPRVQPALAAVGDAYVFDGSDLLPCQTYVGWMTGVEVTEEGNKTHLSNAVGFTSPCVGLGIEFDSPGRQCGATAPETKGVTLSPKSLSGEELVLLTLALSEPDNVVFSVNQPLDGVEYEHELDLSQLGEGIDLVYATLSDGEGREVEIVRPIAVDRQPPNVEWLAPVEGASVCRQLSVSALVEDTGVGKLYGGVGSDPESALASQDLGLSGLAPLKAEPSDRTVGYQAEPAVNLSGPVPLYLGVADEAGNTTCVERTVTIDGQAPALGVDVSSLWISPNGDGKLDTIDIGILLGESASVSVRILSITRSSVKRTIFEGTAAAGRLDLSWDGTSDGGSVLGDFGYWLEVEAVDGCGNSVPHYLRLVVDTTPPQLAIESPLPGDPLPLLVPVSGSVRDGLLRQYVLYHGQGAAPVAWAPIETRAAEVDRGWLGDWDTFGLEGQQTLRLRAEDKAGNEAETSVTVDIPERGDLIESLRAVPRVASPNGDGIKDQVHVEWFLTREASVSLEILDTNGAAIATLLVDDSRTEGSHMAVWDGVGSSGSSADGGYSARLTAADAGGSSQQEDAEFVLDRAPPQIEIDYPSTGFAPPTFEVVATVSDPNLEQYVLSLASSSQPGVWDDLAQGSIERAGDVIATLSGLAEGEYELRLSATDVGSNAAEARTTFVVDQTPPAVTLEAPPAGSMLSAATSVPISATIVEENPASYNLEFGAGAAPPAWTVLVSGSGLPPGQDLAAWDVSALADGPYTLRLTAEDLAGQTAQASVVVDVDNTPPSVTLTQPQDGGFVTQPMDILGTVEDLYLDFYRVEVAAAGGGTWSYIGGGEAPVVDGPLVTWSGLPPGGQYQLRLSAQDRAGNASSLVILVTVDQTPPAAPAGVVAVLDDGDVNVSWNANTEADLDHYLVFRNGAEIGTVPAGETTLTDPAVNEGQWSYVVRAVDEPGLISDPSAAADIRIDTAPPLAILLKPVDKAVVSGAVETIATVQADDLSEYRLSVRAAGEPAPGDLLHSGVTPIAAETIAYWDTSGLPEGAGYILRLEAEDLTGNQAVAESSVIVDNLAPSAPTGLDATVAVREVALTWTASPEEDVAGYLVYRDGQLISSEALTREDLVRTAVRATAYDDVDVADGTYQYTVTAIDNAGNISPHSAPAAAVVEQGPPAAVIVVPDEGHRFDSALYVRASTDSQDIATLRFEYQALEATAWIAIDTLSAPPWETVWDPAGLTYGDYRLRALATDHGGLTDPDPASITVTYTDLDRPAQTIGLTALVDGAEVELSWTANTDSDLAGYHLDRTLEGATASIRLTQDPVGDVSFTDSGVPDGSYEYSVIAVDVYDNEAPPSAPAGALVHTPLLERPFTPTRELSLDLVGVAVTGDSASSEVTSASGTVPVGDVPVGADGGFSFAAIPLERGTNDITVVVEDSAGNRSKPAAALVTSGIAPSPPVGLDAVVTDLEVDLSWQANPEPDIVGYRAFRGGAPLLPTTDVAFSSVSGSSQASSSTAPSKAIDGSIYSYWAPFVDENAPVNGQWLEVHWDAPLQVSGATLRWYAFGDYYAVDYELAVWDGGGWLPISSLTGNQASTNPVDFGEPYRTTGLRLTLWNGHLPESDFNPVRLAEIDVHHQPLSGSLNVLDSPGDGVHDYTVTAVNALGFASDPSLPLEVGVGDTEPPPPVVLSGTAVDSSAHLNWTESPASDLSHYLVYRNGLVIAQHTALLDRTYLDADLVNAVYTYAITAVDQVGNESEPSNELQLVIAVAGPDPPTDLVVLPVATGGALDLSWQPGPGSPASFSVQRAPQPGGPYERVADGIVGTAYRDTGLTNGTTYYYTVLAVDSIGNQSGPSNEASGTPEDVVAPQTVLHYPAFAGVPFKTGAFTLDSIAGRTEPGSTVEIHREGLLSATSQASGQRAIRAAGIDTSFYQLRPSPDGRYVWIDSGYDVHQIVDLNTGEITNQTLGFEGQAVWMPDGRRIAFGWSALGMFDLVTGSSEFVDILEYADEIIPSPDGQNLAIRGYDGEISGLFLFDIDDRSRTSLVDGSYRDIEFETVAWSPDGSRIAYRRDVSGWPLEIVEVGSGGITTVEIATGSPDVIRWSPDGGSIVYTVSMPEQEIWRYDLDLGVSAPVVEGTEAWSPAWSPAGDAIAYLTAAGAEILDLGSGAATPVAGVPGQVESLQWTRGGHLFAITDDDDAVRITPAGHFTAGPFAVDAGDNRFIGVAIDGAGNRGPASQAIVVTRTAADAPDLVVTDLVVAPGTVMVGSEIQVTATVQNQGGQAAAGSVAEVVVAGPQQTSAGTLPLGGLSPGEATSVTTSLSITGTDGRYTAIAVADADDEVAEADEANNRREGEFFVLQDANPAVFLQTDASFYSPGDPVVIDATLLTAGPEFAGSLEISIEDSAGFPVVDVDTLPITGLEPGTPQELQRTWHATSVVPGDYAAVAVLLDPLGAVVADAMAGFSIVQAAELAVAATTDSSAYIAGETVAVTCGVENQGSFGISGIEVGVSIVTGAGIVQEQWQQEIAFLASQDSADVAVSWQSTGATAGQFKANCTASHAGQEKSAATTFEIVEPATGGVTGSLSLADNRPIRGTELEVAYAVHNHGDSPLSAYPADVALVDVQTGAVEELVSLSLDLDPTSTYAAELSVPTTGLGLRDYLVLLAGGGATVELARAAFRPIDGTAPAIDLLAPEDGAVTPSALEVTARIVDAGSGVDGADVSLDGGNWLAMQLRDPAQGTFGLAIDGLADGVHTLTVAAADVAGNRRQVESTFVVDTLPPEITVSGVIDGETYSQPVAPQISVIDPHLESSAAVLNGVAFESGTTVSERGDYVLEVVAVDAAGNRSDVALAFSIGGEPILGLQKSVTLAADVNADGQVNPGEEIEYVLNLSNSGDGDASAVVVSDPLPSEVAVVPGSVTATLGNVDSESPLTVSMPQLVVGDSATITFRAKVASPFPPTVLAISNQASVEAVESAPVPSDDPGQPGDDDPTTIPVYVLPSVSVMPASGGEADPIPVQVQLSVASNRPVSVDYATTPGTAEDGVDFVPASGTVAFAAGETQKVVLISPIDDELDEPDEQLTLRLSSVSGAVIAGDEATVTITDDDVEPTVSVAQTSLDEGDSDSSEETVNLNLSAASGREVQVDYETVEGTALAGSDFVSTAGSVTFAPGEVDRPFTLEVLGDLIDELDEQFTVELSDPVNATLIGNPGTITIVDDDEALISVDDTSVDEGDAGTVDATFNVRLSTPSDRQVSAHYETVGESAAEGVDYERTVGDLTLEPLAEQGVIVVPVIGDSLLEPDRETFRLELLQAENAAIGDGVAIGTIFDDESCISPNLVRNGGGETAGLLAVPSWQTVSGLAGVKLLTFLQPVDGDSYIELTTALIGDAEIRQDISITELNRAAQGEPVKLHFQGWVATTDGTFADTAQIVLEYRDASNTMVLGSYDSGEIATPSAWQQVSQVVVPPPDAEFVRIRLLFHDRALLPGWGLFDAISLSAERVPGLWLSDVLVGEPLLPGSDPTSADFHVALSCAFHQPVVVEVATVDGTATAPEDYQATSGTLAFAPGETSKIVSVPVFADLDLLELSEDFYLSITATTPADIAILDGTGRGEILDPDLCLEEVLCDAE